MSDETPSPQSVVVPVCDLLFYKLKDLITEQSEGEWTDEMVVKDAHHFANQLRPLLAAAPAPPSLAGGEVLKALDEALVYIEQLGENIERNDLDMRLDVVERPFRFAQTMRGRFPSLCAALSPEAPAREGGDLEGLLTTALTDELQDGGAEVPYSIIAERVAARVADEASAPSCLTPCHEAPAEGAGERTKGAAELQAELDQLANEYGDLLAEVEALRARSSAPEAREEAVAVTIFCPQCALPHVDEGEWATTRQHKTHQCQGCGHEWRPFPFATVGVTHPAASSADKLRIAVEALEPFANLGVSSGPDDEPCHYAYRITRGAIRNARQALAALKWV